ncbi:MULTISPECIES: hypothetical protein [Bacillus]|uniref:hypothetical protein n=1 Tax=Bacillus TaxID=1386 RepID=UPI001583E8EC|nr:hypothetical protein [Bacillus glycinifermentans]MBU8789020.1 hypothetical protein [Bacillus glycinifermentans]NUJ18026.1 hypothetical protein [Bacillus glycinifermentans]WKB77954.1 hypothetical protein QYM22_03445 [Bacillus glycinifermentans]
MSDFITEKEMDSIRKIQLSDSQYKLYSGLKKKLKLADHHVINMTWGELKKEFAKERRYARER